MRADESIFLSRVEGSMSRTRVPCRGSRVTFFFFYFFFFFLEKVIIDAINVIKTIGRISKTNGA